MKASKRILALALAGTMALGLTAGAASFPDVDDTTPEGIAIAKLSEMGVLGGFEDGTFGPEKTVTRAQFAKIVYMLENQGTTDPNADAFKGESVFTDVAADKWFAGFVNWANKQGIVGGMGDGTFAPDATLTMGQAIKMYVTSKGTSAEGVEYPQGFIDIATEAGFLANVAEFTANDAAPRGTIALVGFNTLEDGGAVVDGKAKAIVTEATATTITFANADENGRGTIPTAENNAPGIESAAKNNITYAIDEDSIRTAELAADCKVTLVDGDITSTDAGTEGTVADIVASDSSKFYSAEYTSKGGKITAITYYKTGVSTELKQINKTFWAKATNLSVYYKPGVPSEIALGTHVSAPNGMDGSIISFTQPKHGKVSVAKSGLAYRLDYEQPAEGLAAGDSTSFTFTVQNADKSITSTAVVKMNIVAGTKIKPYSIVVAPGEKYSFTHDELYGNVTYAPGTPVGVPSFLIYDDAAGKVVGSGKKFTTEAGAEIIRTPGDAISYSAPAAECEDIFYMSFHDGVDSVIVPVTVAVVNG